MLEILGVSIGFTVFWLIMVIVFLIVEGITVGLATIWFAAGALVALLLSLADVSFGLQFAVFLIVSVGLLISTRKIFVEKLKAGSEKTNVDALIGEKGLVVEDIKPYASGQVKVKGQMWTAVCHKEDVAIEAGSLVKIRAIEGVKLVVAPVEQKD